MSKLEFKKKDYINKLYILEKYKVTYLVFLPPIKSDNISKNLIYKASPRQKTLGRLKKARIRYKIRPTKPHHCSICGSSKHKRQSCAHRRDTEEPERRPEEEPEEDFSSDSDMDEVERARIETEAQRVQRIIDVAEIKTRNKDTKKER